MHLPQQQGLSGDTYQETKNMLSVKANKTMIYTAMVLMHGSMSPFTIVYSIKGAGIKATLGTFVTNN